MPEILSRAPVPFNGTEIHTLANGLTLIYKEDHTVPVVSMQVWVNCGAIHETPRIAGISHCLEHMLFKGTPTRSAGMITRLVESNGGLMNAATQTENTNYYIDIPSYSADIALDVLADTVSHPAFPEDELERERLVILEEIKRRNDSPSTVLWDEFVTGIFQGTMYGKRIIGSKETVSALSRNDLVDYFSKYYVPEKMCLVIVGDWKKSKVLKKAEALLGKVSAKQPPPEPTYDDKVRRSESLQIKKPVQLTYTAMGIPTVGLKSPDAVKMDLLSDVLGGGISCRLFQHLREELKLALSTSSDYMTYQDKGIFALFAECSPEKAAELQDKMREEVQRLKTVPITREELKRAKTRIKSGWLHDAETFQEQASTMASFYTSGRMDLLGTYLRQVEKTTLDDLNTMLETYILNQDIFMTEVVPDGNSHA